MQRSNPVKTAILIFPALFFMPFSGNASGSIVDHSIYANLLKKYVKNGVVDYRGFKEEESRLDEYLSMLEKTDSKILDRNELFAFYINAYNVWTIKLILSSYPGVKSIKDLDRQLDSSAKAFINDPQKKPSPKRNALCQQYF